MWGSASRHVEQPLQRGEQLTELERLAQRGGGAELQGHVEELRLKDLAPPEMAMIGRSGATPRIATIVSIPSLSGMTMSVMTASGRACSTMASARRPSGSVSTP